MEFTFTHEQEMMRRMVRDFARNGIAPAVKEMDEEDQFPRAIIKEMGRLGLMGIPDSGRWGGAGADSSRTFWRSRDLRGQRHGGVIVSVHTSVGTFRSCATEPKSRRRSTSPAWPGGNTWAPSP